MLSLKSLLVAFGLVAVAAATCAYVSGTYGSVGGTYYGLGGWLDLRIGDHTYFRRDNDWYATADSNTFSGYDNVRFVTNSFTGDLYAVAHKNRTTYTETVVPVLLKMVSGSPVEQGELEVDSTYTLYAFSYFVDAMFVSSTEFWVTWSPDTAESNLYRYDLTSKTGSVFDLDGSSGWFQVKPSSYPVFSGVQGFMIHNGSDVVIMSTLYYAGSEVGYSTVSNGGNTVTFSLLAGFYNLPANCDLPYITDATENPETGFVDVGVLCYEDDGSGGHNLVGTFMAIVNDDWDVEIVSEADHDFFHFAFHEECADDPAYDI